MKSILNDGAVPEAVRHSFLPKILGGGDSCLCECPLCTEKYQRPGETLLDRIHKRDPGWIRKSTAKKHARSQATVPAFKDIVDVALRLLEVSRAAQGAGPSCAATTDCATIVNFVALLDPFQHYAMATPPADSSNLLFNMQVRNQTARELVRI